MKTNNHHRAVCYLADRLCRDFPSDVPPALQDILSTWCEEKVVPAGVAHQYAEEIQFLQDLDIVLHHLVSGEVQDRKHPESNSLKQLSRSISKLFASDISSLIIDSDNFYGLNEAPFKKLAGRSASWNALIRNAHKVSCNLPSTTLLVGESGTGKDSLAEAIHLSGVRRSQPFVKLSCQTLVDAILPIRLKKPRGRTTFIKPVDGEIFAGWWKRAMGGSLYIDHVDCLTKALQYVLLEMIEKPGRFLEKVDSRHLPRLIFSSQTSIEKAVIEGRFDASLYYRLRVVELRLPPLRSRPDDLPEIVDAILKRFAEEKSVQKMRMHSEAMALLRNHSWPGNIRELESVLEQLYLKVNGVEITPASLTCIGFKPGTGKQSVPLERVSQFEKILIENFNSFGKTTHRQIAAVLLQIGHDRFKVSRFARDLEIGTTTARKKLNLLLSKNFVKKEGDKKGTCYHVLLPESML